MDELVTEFLTETNESLDELDNDLVNLEQNPNDTELLSKIFRLMHTIKGTCGFLDLPRLAKVAHHAENVLGRFRDGDLKVTPAYVSLIFESIDAIKTIVHHIGMKGSEPDNDYPGLIARLDAVYEGQDTTEAPAPVSEPEPAPAASATASFDDDIDFTPVRGPDYVEKAPAPVAEAKPPAPAPAPVPAPVATATADHGETDAKAAAAAAQTLRVNVDVLENLMTMVSELVLTRNQLLQILRNQSETDFTAPLQRLNHVVSDLQEGVMQTRMQPIGNAWSKLPRIIRDLSMELGKKIDLEMIGQETELDRQVLELIKDPLTHMVRNSADHGVEMPAARAAAGKNETGKIILHAYHEGGHIIIKIADDGKGLSTQRIKEKIVANGLATEAEVATMSLQQIQQFIFKAGFSTAEKVTSVSGRGVGMDVVRTNIEKIGGSIELKSEEGKGSTFTIKIPLTLAIVSALIVESAGERFAIPQLAVRELVMASHVGENRIEVIKGTPVLRLRNHLLPLVALDELLRIKIHSDIKRENHYIVVTQIGNYSFGIIVDRVFDTEEIVVKPVCKMLRGVEIFSGNTILGDGTVIMILDPNGIARASGEIESGDTKMNAHAGDLAQSSHSAQKTALLLFAAGDAAPKAVPLSLVARLENIKMDDIEYSGNQMLVQYRGHLMPLSPFNAMVQIENQTEKPVLVFSDRDISLGLIVDKIIDITEEHIDVQVGSSNPALMGSAIINGEATDIIDVAHFLQTVNRDWFKNHGDDPFDTANNIGISRKKRILLVDDSPFFRNMLTPLLSVAGYEVTTLESPIDALKLCDNGMQFDLIVSDIEMPVMNGFEFAQKIKSHGQWQDTPIVALTSHATPQDIDRGHQVGFEKYIAKFDRDTLLNALSQTLASRDHAA